MTSELTSLSLVCEENLGSGILTERTQVSPSRMSSPVSVTLSRFSDAALLGELVERAGQRGAKAHEVGAAVALRDVVGEAEHGLVVAVVPLQGDVDRDPVALGGDHDRRVQRLLGAVEVADEGLDPALVEQLLVLRRVLPPVA